MIIRRFSCRRLSPELTVIAFTEFDPSLFQFTDVFRYPTGVTVLVKRNPKNYFKFSFRSLKLSATKLRAERFFIVHLFKFKQWKYLQSLVLQKPSTPIAVNSNRIEILRKDTKYLGTRFWVCWAKSAFSLPQASRVRATFLLSWRQSWTLVKRTN